MPSHKTHTPKGVKKLVTFSTTLYQHAQNRAQALGLGFAEYLRFLLVDDVKKRPISDLEVLSPEVDKEIGASLKDYAEGRYEILETEADIKKFVDRL